MSRAIIGKVVGNLEIINKIASGGMGTVYRAEHQVLKTPYAVKILHANFSEDRTVAERFRREAIACSNLRHPNVVFVTDFGFQADLGIYIIMEYLEGEPLSKTIKNTGGLALGRMVRISEQICDALEAAHNLGIIHRDLKPDNIFIVGNHHRRDFTKVLDFGIAQVQQGEDVEKLTKAGLVMGTPSYISPEQINGKAESVGPGADIYALGTIFYEMVCGRAPFNEGTDFEVLSAHMFKAPPPMTVHRPELAGTKLESLIFAMLAKTPDERPGSMGEVHTMISEALQELKDDGIQDAFYHGPTGDKPSIGGRDTGQFEKMTPPPLRITNVIQHVKANSPDSAVASLLGAFPGMASLQEEIFHLALWGVLQRELLDHPIDSDPFKHATEHLGLFVEAVLNASESTDGDPIKPDRLMRSISEIFVLADEPRQRAMVLAIQPLTKHHLFPNEILPEWAQVKATGTWSAFKRVMTSEIKLPFGSSGRPRLKVQARDTDAPAQNMDAAIATPAAPPVTPDTEPETPAVPPPRPRPQRPLVFTPEGGDITAAELKAEEPSEDGGYGESLGYKLTQDVSLKTLKNVFTHDLFGGRKKKKKKKKGDPKE